MVSEQQWRAALTRLTRLAQRQPEAETWIEEMLDRNMPGILGAAIQVAEETGPPLPALLVKALEGNASVEAQEAVARSVPIHAMALQDLAITAIRSLLAQPDWPPSEPAKTLPVRRHALRVALATRLSAARRLEEARTVAEQAVAEAQAVLRKDASARARSIDAYDVIAECQLASGDARKAVETARQALTLRQGLDDPFRIPAEGERKLGLALLVSGLADEGCHVLTDAVAHARDLLEHHRDALLDLQDQAVRAAEDTGDRESPNALRVVVMMGWNPNGFDEVILDQGFRIDSLVALLHGCLSALVAALEKKENLRKDLLAPALLELAAGRKLMRRGRDDPDLALRILHLLTTWPDIAEISKDDFDTMAEEALDDDDLELAIRVRQAEAEFFRRTDPVDRWALVDALTQQSQLLANVRPHDAVALMREAVNLVGDENPKHLATELHNLSRRLSESGEPREGLEMSSRAVDLMSDVFLAGDDVSPLVMTAFLETLVQRNLECHTEVEFTSSMVDAAVKIMDDFGHEAGADLYRPVHAIGGLYDSARRQGDMVTTRRIFDAVCRLATQRPDDESIQYARGVFGSQLLWQAVGSGQLDRARALLEEVIEASQNAPHLEVLIVEHGKSVTDLIDAYQQADDDKAAAQLAQQSIGVLLSPAYLTARQHDLGGDQTEFIQAVQELAQQAGRAG